MKENVTQFDKAEALDRIHVIQTMLTNLLVETHVQMSGLYSHHRGLSADSTELVLEAMEKLCEAYQMQGAFVFEENTDG